MGDQEVVYVVRDFYTDIFRAFDTRPEAEAQRDKWNAHMPDDNQLSITVYDRASQKVISHD